MKRDNWSSPDLLPKQIVLVDGVTRSGKSMIGPVIGSLNKTYPMQHQDLLNNLMPILHKKKISIEAARSLLIFYFNQNVYSLNISRCVNFRPADNSSLVNVKDSKKYLKNLNKMEGDYVIDEIKRRNFLPVYMTHDLLSMIDSFNKLKLPYKLIYAYRHPIDNIFSFFKKYGDRLKSKNKYKYNHNNPRIYQMMIKEKGVVLPYYVEKKVNEFLNLSDAEKSVFYYFSSMRRSIEKYRNFKKNILMVRYEDFAVSTQREVKRISKFLGCNPTNFTKKCLKFNNLPRIMNHKLRKEKKEILRKLINKKLFKEIEILSDRYEKKTIF